MPAIDEEEGNKARCKAGHTVFICRSVVCWTMLIVDQLQRIAFKLFVVRVQQLGLCVDKDLYTA